MRRLVRTFTLPLLAAEGSDWFECRLSLRLLLEERGWRILCNGARVNAWPSGMSRDMGGAMVYLYPDDHRPRTRDDLVRACDEASPELVVTVQEQRADFDSH